MKSFAAIILFAASMAMAQDPVVYNSTTGVFTCPASNPNGAFCAGTIGQTNIIIRCTNGIGQPGNCNDNLAGEPPLGLSYAPCWATSNTSGDAACSKNCIVYGASGNAGNRTFPVPGCTQTASTTATSTSTSSSTSSPTSSSTSTNVTASTTSSVSHSKSSSSSASESVTTVSTSITATVTTICTTGTTTYTTTYLTTYCPSSTLSSIVSATSAKSSEVASSTTSATTSAVGTISPAHPAQPPNGTLPTSGASSGFSATATPVGPTSPPLVTTNGAVVNSGSTLAVLGLVLAYFL